MNDVFIIYIIRRKKEGGFETVLTLIHPDEGKASALAGEILDRMADRTGLRFTYLVEPLPYATDFNTHEVMKLADEVADDLAKHYL